LFFNRKIGFYFLLLSSLFQSSHVYFHSAYLVKFESVDLEHAWEERYNFFLLVTRGGVGMRGFLCD